MFDGDDWTVSFLLLDQCGLHPNRHDHGRRPQPDRAARAAGKKLQ
jgi:hypothetical protein